MDRRELSSMRANTERAKQGSKKIVDGLRVSSLP